MAITMDVAIASLAGHSERPYIQRIELFPHNHPLIILRLLSQAHSFILPSLQTTTRLVSV